MVGVRGTKFYMHTVDSKQVICTIEGKVQVSLLAKDEVINESQEPVLVNGPIVEAGQGLFIDEKNQTKLDKTDPKKVENWLKETDI